MKRVFEILKPRSIEKVAGSGNKFIHLVEDLSEYYINLVPGIKYWDMCASEAIINSRYGLISDSKQRPLYYNSNYEKYTIMNGIICAKDQKVYDLSMQRMKENGWPFEDIYSLI